MNWTGNIIPCDENNNNKSMGRSSIQFSFAKSDQFSQEKENFPYNTAFKVVVGQGRIWAWTIRDMVEQAARI